MHSGIKHENCVKIHSYVLEMETKVYNYAAIVGTA